MADKQTKTTSSKSLDGKRDQHGTPSITASMSTSPLLPKSGEAQILTKLAQNLTDSYQIVKRRQQKYNELTTYRNTMNESAPQLSSDSQTDEWQEVSSAKNKLKRKKKLSASLTSVSDTVNQEKRTRIEGVQLNCRGKLQLKELTPTPTQSCGEAATKVEKPAAKQVTPPQSAPPATKQANAPTHPEVENTPAAAVKVAPPRLKRKLQENVQTIQKLNALMEQLRLEINELKSHLTTERGAVRVLRAQNESETRKWKNEVKKLQNTLELMRKNGTGAVQGNSSRKLTDGSQANVEISPNAAVGSLANYEVQRLTNEINALKEANKALEEKKMINCDADRRKAADMRTLKDSYEIRLTQLTKSAKIEISRLLEEIKTKERNIGQLKKDLQVLQCKSQNETKSRNATTVNNTTNKTTIKPKKTNLKLKPNSNETNPAKKEDDKESSQVQEPNEMKKLKDLELINNTKNLQNNVNLKTTKLHNTNSQQHNKYKSLDLNEANHKTMINDENANNLLKTATPNTTPTTTCGHQKEYHSLPHELTERLLGNTTTAATTTTTTSIKTAHEYRAKDNNSDSDSALSSAPPSISPQPPPAGLETADIWQTIRTYSTDIEKLQKDIEMLQHENEHLNTELNLAKEQILETEKTAFEATNNTKIKQFIERIKYLEEQEHQLQAEANEMREQNELLEFRILELEETNDKWSVQGHTTPSTASPSQTTALLPAKDVWGCVKPHPDDPMQMLFGSTAHTNMDSDITSPQDPPANEDDLNLLDHSNEELRQRVANIFKKYTLDAEDSQCLQQVFNLLQQLDVLLQRSGPDSLNTTSSNDEPSSLDLVKSRVSDYSSASSSSSAHSTNENVHNSKFSKSAAPIATASRIVATVPPYNSSPQHQQLPQHLAPTNTPTESPRKSRYTWQSNSLSESGVFVESDFFSDTSENNVCTQTDFDEELGIAVAVPSATAKEYSNSCLQKIQRCDNKSAYKVPAYPTSQLSPNFSEQKRLQYYKERLELLESKVLIYESSGDLQAKRLADRLQREIQLEKQLKELRDRVDCLECENSTLEEEKCEFEEAENDTRLRLQRLEVELEILSQRNIELEMSREALSAKYKDCRSECLILRDDLAASETQIRHLDEDKLKVKEKLELLYNALPLLLICNSIVTASQQLQFQDHTILQVARPSTTTIVEEPMGNVPAIESSETPKDCVVANAGCHQSAPKYEPPQADCRTHELHILKDEVKCLRHQMKELNSRHYEAMESADSHWVELERDYKDREASYRAKEVCLKQKINKLQDCLRDDARAADEKILQMEEAEKELKTCLIRISKEHREIHQEQQNVIAELDRYKEQCEQLKEQQKPLNDALEAGKKSNKSLSDELAFMRKLQQELEARSHSDMESLRKELYDLRKECMHIEVTNGELKEEVATLEQQIETLHTNEKEHEEKIRTLTDEVRTKEEICRKLEMNLEHSEGSSLAQELNGSPSKRFKREDVKDLRTATQGLGSALRNIKDCESKLPTHEAFQIVARDVKKLADTLLLSEPERPERTEPEMLQQLEDNINEQLMYFHTKSMESEFYCTVYYPVKRQVPLEVQTLYRKLPAKLD